MTFSNTKKDCDSLADWDDAFLNISFQDENQPARKTSGRFVDKWIEQASAKHSSPDIFAANALRRLYPKHSLVMSADYRLNILAFPSLFAVPLEDTQLVTNVVFVPLARRYGSNPGMLNDTITLGSFRAAWNNHDFIIHITKWTSGFSTTTQTFVLHEGPEAPARSMLLAAGIWQEQLHSEIWVFNQGFWSKSHKLWEQVQKADWEDVILTDEFKTALKKDVYGFFKSEETYKEFAIPWKRGLILYGPPGNGKTISIKAIMKTCDAEGFTPLYVRSFRSFQGEEAGIAAVFDKARQLSPCVVVLEDLDSLINDGNRSFFLNELDGLGGNDGLLIIGTTNHFERLDPGLSTRPSRFDRKYLFDDPDLEARVLYAAYWQEKLKANKAIAFPDSLKAKVADSTSRFSFAYLKEAFVSSLVLLAGYEVDDKPGFASVLFEQIKALRKQLDRTPKGNAWFEQPVESQAPRAAPRPDGRRDVRALLDELSESITRRDVRPTRIDGKNMQCIGGNGRDERVLLAALSDCAVQPSSSISPNATGPWPTTSSPPISSAVRDRFSSGSGPNVNRSRERQVGTDEDMVPKFDIFSIDG